MSSDRYFLSSPKAYYYFSYVKKIIPKIEVIILIYGIALFSLYWFLWRPAYELEGVTFKYSPTLFFAALWVIGSASGIGYAILGFIHSTRVANEVEEEADKLGEYLYKIESDLQEQLENLHKESPQSYLNPDYDALSEGREILYEKYDALLE